MRAHPPLIVYELSSGLRFTILGRSAYRNAWVYQHSENNDTFSLYARSRRLYLEDDSELDSRFSPNVPPWLLVQEGL